MTVFLPPPDFLDSPRGRSFGVPPQEFRTDSLPDHAAVVIVGGGLAAIIVAGTLWHAGVRDFVIVDRGGRLGGQFLRRADMLGQRVLRSPYDHHPGVEGYRDCELLDFARLNWSLLTGGERRQVRMAQAGHRSVVPMDVFEAYCDHVVAVHGLADRSWPGEVQRIEPGEDGAVVRTSLGDIHAATVVLCTGEEPAAAPAAWFDGDTLPDGVRYWSDPTDAAGGTTVVVGAGLSGAHLVTDALAAGDRVHWIVREEAERFQCADVNASFFRAEGRSRFLGATTWQDRLLMMSQHRRASVMFEFRPGLQAAEEEGRLVVHRGTGVTAVHGRRPGAEPTVDLTDGTTAEGQRVVLALGTRPLIGAELLPEDVVRARDGWPDLDEATLAYRAAPRVHALGAAACMVLGPAARNIDGHRVGTSRVVTSILGQLDASTARQEQEVAHA
ncbi:NAD(P)-binding domain-containing protein [Micromonospora arborensis]|uniref:NAD(P)-binding domain-containing protein n=1 Tax=Micromonospora arborensis TaxID=2116518 RepID=UPI003433042F